MVRALSLYSRSRDAALDPLDRFRALEASFLAIRAECEREPLRLRLATLARVSHDYGARTVGVVALKRLLEHIRLTGSTRTSPFCLRRNDLIQFPSGRTRSRGSSQRFWSISKSANITPHSMSGRRHSGGSKIFTRSASVVQKWSGVSIWCGCALTRPAGGVAPERRVERDPIRRVVMRGAAAMRFAANHRNSLRRSSRRAAEIARTGREVPRAVVRAAPHRSPTRPQSRRIAREWRPPIRRDPVL